MGALAALLLGAGVAEAADEVILRLKWVNRAQLAGYYVAVDKGATVREISRSRSSPADPTSPRTK